MRGLAQGEQSTNLIPTIQLFCRKGEFLADPVEATYRIEDIRDPEQKPVVKILTTNLDLTDAPVGYKLGTGRFCIPTGDTTGWAPGTHRAICRFKMESAGRDYVQIIDFEILNASLIPTGQGYVGYASTRDLYLGQYATMAAFTPEQMHPYIKRISLGLESVLERCFEPRYIDMRLNGDKRRVLYLMDAIIAADEISKVSRNAQGVEEFTLYAQESYRVMNRHLDGTYNDDDRCNPAIFATSNVIGMFSTAGHTWPPGDRNISVKGVFGYTDPEPGSDGVLIGTTPDELIQVIGILLGRTIQDPGMSSPAIWRPGTVKGYKTRDQQIQFFGATGAVDLTHGIMDDPMLSALLERFVKPARLSYAERAQVI